MNYHHCSRARGTQERMPQCTRRVRHERKENQHGTACRHHTRWLAVRLPHLVAAGTSSQWPDPEVPSSVGNCRFAPGVGPSLRRPLRTPLEFLYSRPTLIPSERCNDSQHRPHPKHVPRHIDRCPLSPSMCPSPYVAFVDYVVTARSSVECRLIARKSQP